MLTIGATIDRYRIEARVGEGGMAVVYRARHVQLDSAHAVKVLQVTGASLRQRLLREGKVQANLRHSNVIRVTDVLEVGGSPALVMEFVDGPSLDVWLLERRPTLEEALWLFRGIVRGVGAAHARGVVHRDLKPANVLLAPTSDGLVPKVTDFGLVKSLSRPGSTQTGMALGTPEYMSPEQVRDPRSVDQRADLWALGCILYELACGQRAFTGADRRAILHRIVQGEFESPRTLVPDLPANVERVLLGLLEICPSDRIESAHKVLELLQPADHARHVYQVPTSMAPPLHSSLPLDFAEDSDEPPCEVEPVVVDSVRTAEPAMSRVASKRVRLSTRATAEFPAFKRRSDVSIAWSMVLPLVVATLVGVLLTLLVVGPLVARGTFGGAMAPGTDEAPADDPRR